MVVITVVFLALLTSPAYAERPEPEDNLGSLTSYAIHELDFDQGQHSSDPSGDGHGPDTDDEPRKGLANVVERGMLEETIALIAFLLGL
jgi:hypothetical protein